MIEFDYLIFANDAKEPIAGFMFRDHAVEWVKTRRWGKGYTVEIRGKSGETFFAFTTGTRGEVREK